MAHRNRWFTELKNGGSFHGYVSHNQMVTDFNQPNDYHTLHGENSKSPCWTMFDWLVLEPTPLKNDGVRQLGLLFPIYGKIKHVPVTTNQIYWYSNY